MTTPRYSREDFAHQVRTLVAFAAEEAADPRQPDVVAVHRNVLRATAAMLSEAANRAPTHNELVEMILRTPSNDYTDVPSSDAGRG